MKASDLVDASAMWAMQAHAVEVDNESILHLPDSEAVKAPLVLHEITGPFPEKKVAGSSRSCPSSRS
jgi:hypothetical protein